MADEKNVKEKQQKEGFLNDTNDHKKEGFYPVTKRV